MNLKIEINNIKNIEKCTFDLPIEKGIFCIVGANGCGKSTLLSCIAQTVFSASLQKLNEHDYDKNSYVAFNYENETNIWKNINNNWKLIVPYKKRIHFNGMYEGSLFYGTRFNDSLVIDDLVKEGKITIKSIADADDYVKDQLSFILHGDKLHYRNLKRVRNKSIAKGVNLKNTPYFQEIKGNLISQYRMSSGECLLISLLHFIYNALIRRSLPDDQPILMLIDEIELALHPVAVSRLLDLLQSIIIEHDALTVVLTSHSPEVIRKISPNNIYMMELDSKGTLQANTPCYPSYAIRDVYMHDGFDYVIFVEDILAKYVVEKVLKKNGFNKSRLINVLPVGGWENVLRFQIEVYNTNSFGTGTNVFSILDGDVSAIIPLKYKSLPKLFLPIKSIEKYLYSIITEDKYKLIKKEINDEFFNVYSIDEILSDYYKEGDQKGKNLYRKLLTDLEKRGIMEHSFIRELCDIIMKHEDFSKFEEQLKEKLM